MKTKLPIPLVLGPSSDAFESIRDCTQLSLEQLSSYSVQIDSIYFECVFANILESNMALQGPGDSATGKSLNEAKLPLQELFPGHYKIHQYYQYSSPWRRSVSKGVTMAFSIYHMKALCLFIDIMSSWINVSLFFYVSQVSFFEQMMTTHC